MWNWDNSGGDCAGISDLMSALESELSGFAPDKKLLAVPFAGEGLLADPVVFRDRLIYLERLLGDDLRGMPGTPFGTSRGNPLLKNRQRVEENLDGFGFLYGTGGNGGLSLFRELAQMFPDMTVVAAPKTIDGDVSVGGKVVQSLGFSSAVNLYRQQIFGVDVTNQAVRGVNVVEVFGRDGGLLAFESARTDGVLPVGQVVDRRLEKMMRRRAGTMMVLVPERPVSLEEIAREVARKKAEQGHCTVVVAEGFMPVELQEMILKLSAEEELRARFSSGRLNADGLMEFLMSSDFGDQDFLIEILRDREQAEFFLNMLYGKNGVTISADHEEVRIPAVRRFLIEAIKRFSGERPRRSLLSYEARGAGPNGHDSQMARRLGFKMAGLIRDGVQGGRVVYYGWGEDPYHTEPRVASLSEVGTGDGLAMYGDEVLKRNGVFW